MQLTVLNSLSHQCVQWLNHPAEHGLPASPAFVHAAYHMSLLAMPVLQCQCTVDPNPHGLFWAKLITYIRTCCMPAMDCMSLISLLPSLRAAPYVEGLTLFANDLSSSISTSTSTSSSTSTSISTTTSKRQQNMTEYVMLAQVYGRRCSSSGCSCSTRWWWWPLRSCYWGGACLWPPQCKPGGSLLPWA